MTGVQLQQQRGVTRFLNARHRHWKRPQQRAMYAAEAAVGHQHHDVTVTMLAHDGRDDVVVVGNVARLRPSRRRSSTS